MLMMQGVASGCTGAYTPAAASGCTDVVVVTYTQAVASECNDIESNLVNATISSLVNATISCP